MVKLVACGSNIHDYYVKNQTIMTMALKSNTSWILKAIMKMGSIVTDMTVWNNLMQVDKFHTRKIYADLNNTLNEVSWKKISCNNPTRPQTLFTLWVACHGRLATKDRLVTFRMTNDEF